MTPDHRPVAEATVRFDTTNVMGVGGARSCVADGTDTVALQVASGDGLANQHRNGKPT